jgi:hypothetical protein
MTPTARTVALCPLLLLFSHATTIFADPDWPGLWGASRNGTATGQVTAAPDESAVLWRRPVAGGYSEIAIDAELAVTMELHNGADFIVALEAASGRERWRVQVGPTYKGHGGSDDGPISTPAVERWTPGPGSRAGVMISCRRSAPRHRRGALRLRR